MDPESEKLLEETHRLVEENNSMLHSMRRSLRVQRVIGYLYWAFIVLTAIGAYYFIEPYLGQLMDVYGSAGDILNNFGQ